MLLIAQHSPTAGVECARSGGLFESCEAVDLANGAAIRMTVAACGGGGSD